MYKNTESKIPTINSGVVAAATTPELIVGILNSVFFKIFKYSVTLARYRHTP